MRLIRVSRHDRDQRDDNRTSDRSDDWRFDGDVFDTDEFAIHDLRVTEVVDSVDRDVWA